MDSQLAHHRAATAELSHKSRQRVTPRPPPLDYEGVAQEPVPVSSTLLGTHVWLPE